MSLTLPVSKQAITVEQVGQYGVRVGDKWYGVNKPIEPHNFVPGQTYEVLVIYSKNGKAYIKQIVGSNNVVTSVVKPVKEETTDKEVVSSSGNDYIKRLEDKNEQIKRQGLIQASLQSPGLAAFASNAEEYWSLVVNFAEKGIKFVENR